MILKILKFSKFRWYILVPQPERDGEPGYAAASVGKLAQVLAMIPLRKLPVLISFK